jgi:hypothetical protein
MCPVRCVTYVSGRSIKHLRLWKNFRVGTKVQIPRQSSNSAHNSPITIFEFNPVLVLLCYKQSQTPSVTERAGGKLSFIAIRCIGQHRRRGNSICQRLANLSEGNHRLGCKRQLFRNTSFLATLLALGPDFRQIQTVRDRQAGVLGGYRRAYRYTTVKLSTTRVLARYSSPSELAPRKNQATSTPDRKWKNCSTNCPELCQD